MCQLQNEDRLSRKASRPDLYSIEVSINVAGATTKSSDSLRAQDAACLVGTVRVSIGIGRKVRYGCHVQGPLAMGSDWQGHSPDRTIV